MFETVIILVLLLMKWCSTASTLKIVILGFKSTTSSKIWNDFLYEFAFKLVSIIKAKSVNLEKSVCTYLQIVWIFSTKLVKILPTSFCGYPWLHKTILKPNSGSIKKRT